MKTFILSVLLLGLSVLAKDCHVRNYGASSIVCVCNATYCDKIEPISTDSISGGHYTHFVSSKAGLRLKKTTSKFTKTESALSPKSALKLTVQRNVKYQEMLGFGGAITDATAINIKSLSAKAEENLMESYFGEGGSQYTILRNPIGASDFSLEYYSFDDVKGDTTLNHFALRNEDIKYKIPIIKKARQLNKRGVKLFASAWSAPYWMKKNGTVAGTSHLLPENYQPWANYYVKYFDAYAKENVKFWGLTAQNEPTQGGWLPSRIISMGWTAEQQRDWIAQHLGPTLHKGGYDYLKLMIMDDNRAILANWVKTVLGNKTTSNYVSGIAVHFYSDTSSDPAILTNAHKTYPDKFILYTEACDLNRISTKDLGSWEKGEQYGSSILKAIDNWVVGWTDWNMVLNLNGGPTWTCCPFNAPIIANSKADEFYKQPMYYFLAHFSSFVPPGSKRIGLSANEASNILSTAFLTPEQETVIVLMNSKDTASSVVISDSGHGNIAVDVQARSIHTILYK
ncbi:lysosomal acid glucosylceramidase-like isoform X2 [Bacillus rossius redtenbacheri]|uniref:lysosomal acid glucosylceramidase-like isoform X2 n=1 Tax=Bacillus rossius redtenbacheri TaxID=93214 RepID=UPI002FDD9649